MRHMAKLGLALSLAFTIAPIPAFAAKTIWQEGDSSLSLSGDIRIRYESDHEESDGASSRDRASHRLRLRLGGEYRANENVSFAARLATAADDDHTTNHVFSILKGGTPESAFGLDKAFLKIEFSPVTLWAGKNENVVWDATGLTWDSDIEPEGFAIRTEFGSGFKGWVTAGYYVVNETGWTNKDNTMLAYQAGASFGDEFSIKAAAGGYTIDDRTSGAKDDLPVPGGSASYLHAMIEAEGRELFLKPAVGLQMVSSNVDKEKQIGAGAKDSDSRAMVVYLRATPGPVTVQFGYWDVGIAGVTGFGVFAQDDYRSPCNYTGWDVSVKGKVFGAVTAEVRYYYQQVKNGAINPALPGDAELGKGKKQSRLHVSLNTQF
jgi:hypothetical protein